MSDLPEPFVDAEVDLQDFPFMPLHVARLRDSDLAAEETPEACWYAVLLWAASWHQIPAASLPDNDTVLMRMVGLGRDARTWRKHRDAALRGFVLCSDGRLYHDVVAEQANEAWQGKIRQRHRTFCAAVRKHNERNPKNKLESPTFEQWMDLGRPKEVTNMVQSMSRVTEGKVTRETPSKGQGQREGQGQGDLLEEAEASPPHPPEGGGDDEPAPIVHLTGKDWPEIPDWIPAVQWNAFVSMRRRKKAWPTDRAVEMLIGKLTTFREQGADPGAILDQSTLKTWTDIYPLKDDHNGNQQQSHDRRDGLERALDRRA